VQQNRRPSSCCFGGIGLSTDKRIPMTREKNKGSSGEVPAKFADQRGCFFSLLDSAFAKFRAGPDHRERTENQLIAELSTDTGVDTDTLTSWLIGEHPGRSRPVNWDKLKLVAFALHGKDGWTAFGEKLRNADQATPRSRGSARPAVAQSVGGTFRDALSTWATQRRAQLEGLENGVLAGRFVNLFIQPPHDGAAGAKEEPCESLAAMLAAWPDVKAWVLMGEPGGGKSTLLREHEYAF
jgi:hypothetical protein